MGFWSRRNVFALTCPWLRRRRWRSGRRGWWHSDTAWTNNDYSYHVERQGRPRNSVRYYRDDYCEQGVVWNRHVLRFRNCSQWRTSRQRSSADRRRVHQQHWNSPNHGHIQRRPQQSNIDDLRSADAGAYRNDLVSDPRKHRRRRSLHSSYRGRAIAPAMSATCEDKKSSHPVKRETT